MARLRPYAPSRKPGLSFIIRARNEALNIEKAVYSILHLADEIILVDNGSKDQTLLKAQRMAREFPGLVRVFSYPHRLPRAGKEHTEAVRMGNHPNLVDYYNWCLAQSRFANIVKWDADFIATRALDEVVHQHRLRTRSDWFVLWFSGDTLFVSEKDVYRKRHPYYQEYRVFSARHGFRWVMNEAWSCETFDRRFIARTPVRIMIEESCFLEVKRTEIDEFSGRSSFLDRRDHEDWELLQALKQGRPHDGLEPF